MKHSMKLTNAMAPPTGGESPEMKGRITEVGGAFLLQCFSARHKIAEFHPGNILKIKDRRCKITFVFDLNEVLRLN